MTASKKRVIKGMDSLTEDLKELLKRQYPNGYESSITRISNAKKEPIFVFPLETEDATYLVKVPTTKNSEGEYAVESGAKQEFEHADDDDLSESDEDFDNATDYDESEGDRANKDPSYEPDFDN